jgi:branched-chain amino acid transport system permease protein
VIAPGALRNAVLFTGLAVLFAFILNWLGAPYTVRVLVEASCYAIIALGLTIQWGYAGLFNAGVMGFIAAAAFVTMFVSFPVNPAFWHSQAPGLLFLAFLWLVVGALATYGLAASRRWGVPRRLALGLAVIAGIVTYFSVGAALAPAARVIVSEAGFVGGLGLPVGLGWIAGAFVAGVLAWVIGRICLGLRSDYLAIATLGIAEIIKAFLKNEEWLTRGTLTVSPLPWPVPGPADLGFVMSRAAYLVVTAILIVVIYMLLERAWHAPWGRMMRAIRDNEEAAEAMGKDVNARRLEIFVLGNVIIGLGGAALISFAGIFDPQGFAPLQHTFLIWVMVILGGAGNNLGAVFGALFVYCIWVISEPAALFLFEIIGDWGRDVFGWTTTVGDMQVRALQMRVFVIGLTISLVLRYAPRGLIPEKVVKHE